MLDIESSDIVREVKDDYGVVVGMIPDIRLGRYTPLPEMQVLCIGDAAANLGAEKIEQLTKQIEHIGILNTFMYYVKTFHATPLSNVETRQALRIQMQKMRAMYPEVLKVSTDGRRSAELDFFNKAEKLMKTVAKGELRTPIDLMGVLMTVYAQYAQETDEDRKSFLARGILAGVEALRGPTDKEPFVSCLLKIAAQRKAYEIRKGYRLKQSSSSGSKSKISFGRWFDPHYKHPSISYGHLFHKSCRHTHYEDSLASRYRLTRTY
ncbi:MAG: hypothetical protein J6Y85_05040 [Alphaproteobacteria bacterium]|nr:hypothetical protein [Alphaproteobacteria bacterium]